MITLILGMRDFDPDLLLVKTRIMDDFSGGRDVYIKET